MKFCWSTLLVKDMDESLAFYRDVIGLELAVRVTPMPGVELAFLNAGGAQLELVCSPESAGADVGNAVSWGFDVEDLDAALALMESKGIPIHSGPVVHPTVKYFFVLDPNGFRIQIKQDVK